MVYAADAGMTRASADDVTKAVDPRGRDGAKAVVEDAMRQSKAEAATENLTMLRIGSKQCKEE